MNPNTGEIFNPKELKNLKESMSNQEFGEFIKDLEPVEENQMTKKQQELQQVSKYDNKSILGRRCLNARIESKNKKKRKKNSRISKNSRKKNRK